MQFKRQLLISAGLLSGIIGSSAIVHAAPQPRKVPIAMRQVTITSPKNKATVSSPVKVQGKAPKNQRLGVKITAVYDGGTKSLGTMFTTSSESGNWTTKPIKLLVPKGAKNVSFKIIASYVENKKTYTSNTVQMALQKELVAMRPPVVAARPPLKKVEPRPPLNIPLPDNYVKPTISQPRANTFLSMPINYPAKGKGTPNRHMKITVTGKWQQDGHAKSRQLSQKTIQIPSNGKWSTEMHYESVGVTYPTSYDVTAADISGDVATVTVHERIPPVIQFPTERDEWLSGGHYIISGLGSPNHELRINLNAHWTDINYNGTQSNGRRGMNSATVRVASNGHWSTRMDFNTVDNLTSIQNLYYMIVVEDTANRERAAVIVKEFK